jgi:hypothetical protein
MMALLALKPKIKKMYKKLKVKEANLCENGEQKFSKMLNKDYSET